MLGYADIYFAQCFIPTKKYFPIWKQIICKYELKSDQKGESLDYEIEDETYTSWVDESPCGMTDFVEDDVIGMETYHKLPIDVIRLKMKEEVEEEVEQEENKEKINPEGAEAVDPSLLIPLDPKTMTPGMISKPDQIHCKAN